MMDTKKNRTECCNDANERIREMCEVNCERQREKTERDVYWGEKSAKKNALQRYHQTHLMSILSRYPTAQQGFVWSLRTEILHLWSLYN